jgi:hypothetical protein
MTLAPYVDPAYRTRQNVYAGDRHVDGIESRAGARSIPASTTSSCTPAVT